MSQPPLHDANRLRRRPRLPSSGPTSACSSARPSSRPRTEAPENAPPAVSPAVSPPATPVVAAVRERYSNTPPPVGWQYPSCSRCLVCGQLGCESCSVRVDPEATRQKLETLRLNTPYERAKLARSTDELRSEEGRQRVRLVGRYESWLEGLRTLELVHRHTVRVVLQETAYRQQLGTEEQSRRATLTLAADQHLLLLALQTNEAAARHTTTALEREGFAGLVRSYACDTQAVRLRQREAITREALRFNEASQWNRLQALEVEARHTMAEHVTQRHRLGDAALEAKEELRRLHAAGLESLALLAAGHREMLRQHAQQRHSALVAVEQRRRDVVAEEAAARLRLREEMLEEAEYMEEQQRIFARQRATLCKAETSQRQAVCEAAEHGYHVIFVDMRADEDALHAAAAERVERQHAALVFALESLCAIQHEEHAAFAVLLRRERDEAAGRQAWIVQKAEARAALQRACVHEKETTIAVAESHARAALVRAAASGEVAVAERIAAKARAQAELSAAAERALTALAHDEHDERFHLLSVMAAEEEQVLRWCAVKQRAQRDVAESEASPRAAIVRLEAHAWQQLGLAFERGLREVEGRVALAYQARHRAVQSAVDRLESVAEEEAQAWAQLCSTEAAQRERAVESCHYRHQLELLHVETQQRACIARDELAARAEARTKATLFARYVTEAALAALHTRLCEVAAAEESARVCFHEDVGDWFAWAAAQQRDEELRLIDAMEQRILAELRSRQQCMTEDGRLYNPDEAPLASSHADDDVAHGRSAAGLLFGDGGASNLRRELLLQTLGNPVCVAPLPAAAVDFLIDVVDRAGRLRDAAQERLVTAERQARDAAKRLQQHERVLAAVKEKKEMYELALQRETQERERRTQLEGQDKARSLQSIAAERRRLADVEAELRHEQDTLDALKGSINKQYRR